jgi:protein-tyrosine phosphatase
VSTGPGYVDLHCHYIAAVDDGVRTEEEGARLCRELARIGYAQVVATPHMRSDMFDNDKAALLARFERFASQHAELPGMPKLGLGAEHYADDVFFERFERGETLAYPGGHAALVELPSEHVPVRIEQRLYRLFLKGVRPVLAHPERNAGLFKTTAPIQRLLEMGALPLLDVMSLVGKYGRSPRKTAERMLEEDIYFAACSDSHKPEDVESVAEGIERLHKLVGREHAAELLGHNPRRILEGDLDS